MTQPSHTGTMDPRRTDGPMASGMLHPGFQGDLIALINKHSLDSLANTPDFIIAGLLVNTFETYRIAKEANEQWHGQQAPRINVPPLKDTVMAHQSDDMALHPLSECTDECFRPGHDH